MKRADRRIESMTAEFSWSGMILIAENVERYTFHILLFYFSETIGRKCIESVWNKPGNGFVPPLSLPKLK